MQLATHGSSGVLQRRYYVCLNMPQSLASDRLVRRQLEEFQTANTNSIKPLQLRDRSLIKQATAEHAAGSS